MILSPSELLRYQRQVSLPEVSITGQENLKRARVLVVGAGGLGCPILTYLTAAGVGNITIIDGDSVQYSNLHRQTLFTEASLGLPKAQEAVKALEQLNPYVKFKIFPVRLTTKNIREIFSDVDIVVDGSDNFATKYLLNDACIELNKVLVSGALFCFEGQCSVFNAPLHENARSASYRCLFPEPPPPSLIPTCAESGVLGVLPGIIGSLQATEVLKIILGIGEILHNRLLIFDALSMRFSEISFSRNNELCKKTAIHAEGYYESMLSNCAYKPPSITPRELKEQLSSPTPPYLIDIRNIYQKREFDIGGILLPSSSIIEQHTQIPKDRPVVIYCQTGTQSEETLKILSTQYGFINLSHLEGGIYAWIKDCSGTG